MAITLDGSVATGTGNRANPSATITTSNSNDILVAFIFSDVRASSFPPAGNVTSVTDNNSLTWTKHKQLQYTTTSAGNSTNDVEIWWALASSPQSSNTVTVNGDAAFKDDNTGVIIQGFTGCNTSTPFDGNAAIPTTGNTSVSSAPSVSSVSTTNASDMLLFFSFSSNNASVPSDQTSVTFGGVSGTILSNLQAVAATQNTKGSVGYLSVASAQSGITYAFNVSDANWAAIATALQAAGGAAAPLRLNSNLDGLSASGGFFRDPLARVMLGWRKRATLWLPERFA